MDWKTAGMRGMFFHHEFLSKRSSTKPPSGPPSMESQQDCLREVIAELKLTPAR